MSKLRRGSAKDVTKCGIWVRCWMGTSQLGSFVNKHEWSVSITFLIQNNITWTNFRRLGGFPAFFTAVTVETSWASELNRPKDFKIKGNDPELSSKTFFPFLLMGLCTRSYNKLNIDLHLGGSCELRDWESKEPICYLTTANKMLKKCFFFVDNISRMRLAYRAYAHDDIWQPYWYSKTMKQRPCWWTNQSCGSSTLFFYKNFLLF